METKIIETPIGKNKIEILSSITGKIKREIDIQKIMRKYMNFDFENIDGGADNQVKTKMLPLSGQIFVESEEKMIELLIVSIDGNKDDVVNKVLDMDSRDYDFIIKHLESVRDGKDFLE